MPLGTVAAICVSLQVETGKLWPCSCTRLLPCELPKFAPLIVTGTPVPAVAGLIPATVTTEVVTAKLTALLAPPALPTCRVAVPAAVPGGITAQARVSVHKDGVRFDPFKAMGAEEFPNPVPF